MKWINKRKSKLDTIRYQAHLKINRILARVLQNRNITEEDYTILTKNPLSLLEIPNIICGASKAANFFASHPNNKYIIFADYDVDGMTSGYVLKTYLKSIGYNAIVHYPERTDGYGLSIKFATNILTKEKAKNTTIVTVDNGITANLPIHILQSNGFSTIVLDHHEPTNELPEGIVCDPWIDKKHGTHLAGVAVTWKICWYINNLLKKDKKTLYNLLPYVALGTISDMMPMTLENRAIVYYGLKEINANKHFFFNEIKKAFDVKYITAKDIAWNIAPKLNAASRMNNANLSAGTFFKNNSDEIYDDFIEIGRLDKKRKELTDEAINKASTINNYSNDAICIYDSSEYPPGISGIIAAKLCETYNKPSIVYTVNKDNPNIGHGSCRSVNGINLKALLQEQVVQGNLISALGHAEACGAELIINKIKDLKAGIKKSIKKLPTVEQSINIDIYIKTKEITKANMDELNKIPYGSGDYPLLALRNVKVKASTPFRNKEHLVLEIYDICTEQNYYAVGWYKNKDYLALKSPEYISIAGTLDIAKFSAKTLGVEYNTAILMIEYLKIPEEN